MALMACGRCTERGHLIRKGAIAARRGRLQEAADAAHAVTRSLTDDAKTFAKALKARLAQRS